MDKAQLYGWHVRGSELARYRAGGRGHGPTHDEAHDQCGNRHTVHDGSESIQKQAAKSESFRNQFASTPVAEIISLAVDLLNAIVEITTVTATSVEAVVGIVSAVENTTIAALESTSAAEAIVEIISAAVDHTVAALLGAGLMTSDIEVIDQITSAVILALAGTLAAVATLLDAIADLVSALLVSALLVSALLVSDLLVSDLLVSVLMTSTIEAPIAFTGKAELE